MQLMNTKTEINRTSPAKPSAGGDHHIFFSVGESPVGKVLVARTIVGVCAVLIGASHQAMESELEARIYCALCDARC